MDKDTDRLEKVTKECNKVGIKFERFSGIKVSDLSQNILDEYVPEETQKYGTNSMLGCALSHLFVWQDAIKNNYNNILVLEDDVYFTDDFNEYLKNIMEELPNDYDILYLGYSELFCQKPKDCSFNYISKPISPLALHAYIVSNKGLKKLVNLITKIDDHIDQKVLKIIKKLDAYLSQKKIVNQIWLDSNNSNLKTKTFPKIINYYLDKVNDCNDTPISYSYNLQLYKYKENIITTMTYSIFYLGILANIHYSILLLCLLYFAYDYDRFHLIVFLLGYFIGNIFKYIMNYYKVNQYATLFLFLFLILFLNIIDFPFTFIKTVF